MLVESNVPFKRPADWRKAFRKPHPLPRGANVQPAKCNNGQQEATITHPNNCVIMMMVSMPCVPP